MNTVNEFNFDRLKPILTQNGIEYLQAFFKKEIDKGKDLLGISTFDRFNMTLEYISDYSSQRWQPNFGRPKWIYLRKYLKPELVGEGGQVFSTSTLSIHGNKFRFERIAPECRHLFSERCLKIQKELQELVNEAKNITVAESILARKKGGLFEKIKSKSAILVWTFHAEKRGDFSECPYYS